MPKATLTSSFGYRDPVSGVRTYYGPGENIDIPDGLALTLGLGQAEVEPVNATPLPADFPGRAALVKAGYETEESLLALTFPELIQIKGIGERTARDILQRVTEE